MEEKAQTYTVSQMTKLCGVTRKTLFYYDRIGLLVPKDRVGPQSRKIYDEGMLKRLQKIIELQACGLKNREIAQLLEDKDSLSVIRTALVRAMEEEQTARMHIEKLNA